MFERHKWHTGDAMLDFLEHKLPQRFSLSARSSGLILDFILYCCGDQSKNIPPIKCIKADDIWKPRPDPACPASQNNRHRGDCTCEFNARKNEREIPSLVGMLSLACAIGRIKQGRRQ